MAHSFRDSSGVLDTSVNVIPYAHHTSSPAARAMREIGRKFESQLRVHWTPVARACGGWTESSVFTTASVCLNYVAGLFLRVVAPFDEFPLKLARLVHAGVPPETKTQIALDLIHMRRCCLNPIDGFTWGSRTDLTSEAEVLPPSV